MRSISRRCQSVTVASTCSASHRCLKRRGLLKVGAVILCSHHRAAAGRNAA